MAPFQSGGEGGSATPGAAFVKRSRRCRKSCFGPLCFYRCFMYMGDGLYEIFVVEVMWEGLLVFCCILF